MSPNIDVSELIGILNTQLANQNLELQIAKLQVATLQKEVDDLKKKLGSVSDEPSTRSKTK